MELPLEIPSDDLDALEVLVELNEQQSRGLIEALRTATPTLYPSRLVKQVAARTSFGKAPAKDVIRVLRGVYRVRTTLEAPLSEIVDAVLAAMDATGRPKLHLEGARRERFAKELSEILSLEETLGVSVRGFELLHEHERTYCSGRIVTDARPVFRSDVSKDPAVMVIGHTLRIDFHKGRPSGGHDVTSFYVAVDSDDLRELRRMIDRALEKDTTMRRVVAKANIQCLPEEEKKDAR